MHDSGVEFDFYYFIMSQSYFKPVAVLRGRHQRILRYISNKSRYPNQNIFIVDIDGYVYLVPFVEDDKKVFGRKR
jgi:hypothetical protein